MLLTLFILFLCFCTFSWCAGIFLRCELIVSKFMELDLDKDNITAFLKDVVLANVDDVF